MGNSKSSGKKVQRTNQQDFRYVNGRQYHNESEAPYWLPSDLDEIDRQQQQHYCFKHLFGSNISAPVEAMLIDGCKVLDVGCGAGIWLLEMATEYDKSKFFGVDMSPVFPIHIKPFNSHFIKANVLNGLTLPSNEFDYIHISFMNVSFTNDQWENVVIPELVRLLKPNGWLELYDLDIIQQDGGPLFERFIGAAQKLLRNLGVDPRAINLFKQWLSSYTFLKEIDEISVYPCVGTWKGDNIDDTKKREIEVGSLIRETFKLFYVQYAEEFSGCMEVSQEKYLELLEECFEQELKNYETKMVFKRVICRKDGVQEGDM